MNRRSLLRTLVAAPIAAMLPQRPQYRTFVVPVGKPIDCGNGLVVTFRKVNSFVLSELCTH